MTLEHKNLRHCWCSSEPSSQSSSSSQTHDCGIHSPSVLHWNWFPSQVGCASGSNEKKMSFHRHVGKYFQRKELNKVKEDLRFKCWLTVTSTKHMKHLTNERKWTEQGGESEPAEGCSKAKFSLMNSCVWIVSFVSSPGETVSSRRQVTAKA